jgi:hypothetical protein
MTVISVILMNDYGYNMEWPSIYGMIDSDNYNH